MLADKWMIRYVWEGGDVQKALSHTHFFSSKNISLNYNTQVILQSMSLRGLNYNPALCQKNND
jgi:hypothetical protein